MKRSATVALFALALMLSGCRVLTPRTAELEAVHAAYRADFDQYVLPERRLGASAQSAVATNPPTFVRALQAIHDYRLTHPAATRESDHLTVLEGMIYIQSGRLGLARLIADEVQAAGSRLVSAQGTRTRDALFAANFPALIDGWAEIHKIGREPARWESLRAAAEAIRTNLSRLDPSPSPEFDSAALYLATTAASFTGWAYNLRAIQDPAGARADGAAWFAAAADLVGHFLTDREKSDVAAAGLAGRDSGRLRAVLWYDALRKSQAAPP